MPTKQLPTQPNPVVFVSDTAQSHPARTTENNQTLRQMMLLMGEKRLRDALPETAIVSASLVWRHDVDEWHVHVKVWSDVEHSHPVTLSEPLNVFPSPTLVAQAMLVT